jgi:hypothetical protein
MDDVTKQAVIDVCGRVQTAITVVLLYNVLDQSHDIDQDEGRTLADRTRGMSYTP